jgi:hypothetical protein
MASNEKTTHHEPVFTSGTEVLLIDYGSKQKNQIIKIVFVECDSLGKYNCVGIDFVNYKLNRLNFFADHDVLAPIGRCGCAEISGSCVHPIQVHGAHPAHKEAIWQEKFDVFIECRCLFECCVFRFRVIS